MKELSQLTRPNIWRLEPYSSARNEYSGHQATVFLDANENPYNEPYNRYPDPLQLELKSRISKVKGVRSENIFLGNGSDEAIDLVYRCFTCPGKDNVVAMEPTYGMYKVCADINDVEYRHVLLDEKFQITAERLLGACDDNTKVIWICSPNNPTGNSINREEVIKTIMSFEGLVIVDEAYIDFSRLSSLRKELDRYPNLIVLNTFSKAWGCAAIRLGMAFAQKDIIDIFNKVKYPYNINLLTQNKAMEALKAPLEVDKWVRLLLQERGNMMEAFSMLPFCEKVYPSDANFFLIKVKDAQGIYDYLVSKGIIVRNRTKVKLCGNCLRITVGRKSENTEVLAALRRLGRS
ncbi:MAG: histidinol-phosphate transaminase [Prevotella sp.]|nr:histidinol-phosphate transaminase [Prevotella sp.]